ncbi:hypothetical protein [Paenibacillus contaminans]|uniref:Uncharacterized protein n=1 Tax=Paenibacillus contaminans TaxID=450362 RepID=A0A329LYJ6_9BACL|nr:hypothetical protein [Paenibacillus contaminans]RAV12156.1 hypothetical protein DQG23_35110 [Paenibacillus contaminans]
MWTIIGILFVTGGIAAIEIPSLRRQKLKKDLWVFTALLAFGASLTIADALNAKIPNMLDWISFLYKPLSDLIYNPLK